MRLEDADSHHRHDTHNHQWHEHVVAVRNLGDEEDTREWGVHHASHHASHAEQRVVLLRYIYAHLIHVPQTREEEPRESSHEERRCERTTATATAVCGCRGECLCQYYQRNEQYEPLAVAREHRVVQQFVPVGFARAVQQYVDSRVSLAVEHGEDEDERAEQYTAQRQLSPAMLLQLAEHALAHRH